MGREKPRKPRAGKNWEDVPLVDVGPQVRQPEPVGEAVYVAAGTGAGSAFVAPTPASYRRLSDAQRRTFARLQDHAEQLAAMDQHMRELVADARNAGVSWGLIGWSLGMTGEGARQRYGLGPV